MIRVVTGLLIAAGAAWSMLAPAVAATMVWCGPHDSVISMLGEQFQEERESTGLSDEGLLMEVFASAAGSWTILLTSPSGLTCIIATGENFDKAAPAAPEAHASERAS
jgi:hypothetical protein